MSDTPAAAPRRRRANPWLLLAIALLGAAAGAGGVTLGRHLAIVDSQALDLGLLDLALLPLWMFAVVAVHELGHVAGGVSSGMRFVLYVVGPLRVWRGAHGLCAGFNRSLATWGGLAACAPRDLEGFRARMMRMVAGGPLASLLLAALAALATLPLDGRAAFHAAAVAALSLAIGLITMVPASAGGFESDGAQWLGLRRGGPEVEQRALVVALYGSSLAGVRPRDQDAAMIERALALPGPPRVALALHAFAYAHALDRGAVDSARKHADAIAAGIDEYPDGFRQNLALELAWFEARHGDAAAAQAWLRRGEGGVVDASLRLRAQAAVALAGGDAATALQRADAALAALSRAMDPGTAHWYRDGLEQVRAAALAGAPDRVRRAA